MTAKDDPRIDAAIDYARATLRGEPPNRDRLAKVLDEIKKVAAITELWGEEDYHDPAADERQARYLIRSDADQAFTLYLNVMRPGNKIPPHNHTTWACVAAIEGGEHNTLYRRIDGGTGAGLAQLEVIGEVDVVPGSGVALLPDDIHSVEITGEKPIRHLHFYGRALEALSERLVFDLAAGTAAPMKMAVATKR